MQKVLNSEADEEEENMLIESQKHCGKSLLTSTSILCYMFY